jgi:hypothetical protein
MRRGGWGLATAFCSALRAFATSSPAARWAARIGTVGALLATSALVAASAAQASPPSSFDPTVEAQNFAITQERQTIYDTPEYQAQLAADSASSFTEALATQAADPGRFFTQQPLLESRQRVRR